MRSLATIVSLSFVLALAGDVRAGDLELVISGLRGAAGDLRVAVFSEADASRFPDPNAMTVGVRLRLATLSDVHAPLRLQIGGSRSGS